MPKTRHSRDARKDEARRRAAREKSLKALERQLHHEWVESATCPPELGVIDLRDAKARRRKRLDQNRRHKPVKRPAENT
jgi:hypothetical protein